MRQLGLILEGYKRSSFQFEKLIEEALFSTEHTDDDVFEFIDKSYSETLNDLSAINQQAYFLMCFAQFESFVTDRAEAVMQRGRQDHRDPATRRAWTTLHRMIRENIRNMPFLDRVALLLDRGDSAYASIRELYMKRNAIAHGTLLGEDLDVAAVSDTLARLAARLTAQETP